ncbi:MAG: acetate--CoA ligase family protein [Acetobacteraceae bacterium]
MPEGIRSARSCASLRALFAPQSVAIVGASTDPGRIGGRPIAAMLRAGFKGTLLPVNPNRALVQGLPAYAAISRLPFVPEAAIVAVPAALAVAVVAELAALGVQALVLFSAGFAEVGEAGAGVQAELAAIARSSAMRILGPNTLGLFDARIGWFPTFTASLDSFRPLPGRIGIASQSGAFGTHIFSVAAARGLGTPVCVTTGNEADVTLGEVILWLVADPGIDVIAVAAEGVRKPDAFLGALAAARAAGKPVIILKVGRSRLGSGAARSHTAAIAGDDEVFSAVVAEHGAIRAAHAEQLLDFAYAATRRIYPAANTLGALTVSGGGGVMIADVAESLGLAMPPMPPDAQSSLRAALPFSAPANPVDCTAQVFNEPGLISRFAECMVAEGGYRSVLAFFSQIGGSPTLAPGLRAALADVRARYPDRLYALSVIAPPERVREYESDGFLVFAEPARAVAALDAMGRIGAAFAAEAAIPPPLPRLSLPPATPNEAEAKQLLAAAGIAIVPERVAHTADAAAAAAATLGYPVVMKILSPDIPHKSDIGGVLLGLGNAEAVRAGHATLMARAAAQAPGARIDGVIVAREIAGAVECILGVKRDPTFGPIALIGLGGIFVEILDDVVLARCPFGVEAARAMIGAIRAAPLLSGARGRRKADVTALAIMLSRLSTFAAAAAERLASIDLNPVLVLGEGEGAYAADAGIELRG